MRIPLLECLYAGLAALLVLPGTASAQQAQAYTNGPVNLRAGPARDYPLVAQLPNGAPLTVMGCINNYTWCDVASPNLRGWVYAAHLNYPYQGANVPVLAYGTTLGLPIVTFSLGTYWGQYYRGRPWYRDQGRWAHRPPRPAPIRPPLNRPSPGGARPPGGGRPPGPGAAPGGRPPGSGGGRPPGNRPAPGRPTPGGPSGRPNGGGGGGGGDRGGPPRQN